MYQDSMTIVSKFNKSNLFILMICNQKMAWNRRKSFTCFW